MTSYSVDFELDTDEAVREAIDELRLRGIDCERAMFDDFELSATCTSLIQGTASAASRADVAQVEANFIRLAEFSPDLCFYVDDRTVVDTVISMITAMTLVVENSEVCQLASKVMLSESV